MIDATAASCGEVAACMVRVPTEIVKQRAQVSKQSIFKIGMELFKEGHIRAFYKGYTSTLTREIPFAFIQYPLWEEMKRYIARRNVS